MCPRPTVLQHVFSLLIPALQWMMINRLLRIMWPKLTESIFKTVIGVVKPIVQDLLNKVCGG